MIRHSYTLEVNAPSRYYKVIIGKDNVIKLQDALDMFGVRSSTIAIVCDSNVFDLYRESLEAVIGAVGASYYILPSGELTKSWDQAKLLLDWMLGASLDRQSVVVAIGGGVTTDLVGFCASVYMRGISYINVPTTLAAMVDAAIGGKTAINFPAAKNVVGSFWQPAGVIIDVSFLETLQVDQLRDGMAEVIKYALCFDPPLVEKLKDFSDVNISDNTYAYVDIIARCVEHKANIVARDERETEGLRSLLNFGHTVGHGIEAATGYSVSHGFAVAVGMRAETRIGVMKNLTPQNCVGIVDDLLNRFLLGHIQSYVDVSNVIKAMYHDKKSVKRELLSVYLENIGSARFPMRCSEDDIKQALKEVLD